MEEDTPTLPTPQTPNRGKWDIFDSKFDLLHDFDFNQIILPKLSFIQLSLLSLFQINVLQSGREMTAF
jgi:hypothetical protein